MRYRPEVVALARWAAQECGGRNLPLDVLSASRKAADAAASLDALTIEERRDVFTAAMSLGGFYAAGHRKRERRLG